MKPHLKGLNRFGLLYFAVTSWALTYFSPLSVSAITERFSVSASTSGWLVSAKLLTMAIASILYGSKFNHLPKRRSILLASVVGMTALAATISASSVQEFVVASVIVGAAFGVIGSCAYAMPAYFSHPEKIYAQNTILMSVIYASAFYCMPTLYRHLNLISLEVFEFGLLAVGLGVLLKFPDTPPHIMAPKRSQVSAEKWLTAYSGAGLFAVFSLFMAVSACSAFSIVPAKDLGIPMDQLQFAFAASALAQLPMGTLVNFLGGKYGNTKPILLGNFMLAISGISIFYGDSHLFFLLAVGGLPVWATLVSPYQMGNLGRIDHSGRSSSIGNAMANFGCATGPALAGALYPLSGAIGLVGVVCLILTLSSFVAFFISNYLSSKNSALEPT